MRKFTVLLATSLLVGTGSAAASSAEELSIRLQDDQVETANNEEAPAVLLFSAQSDRTEPDDCLDRITQARELSGQELLLERQPASPEKPYAIYAVHREQDGCSVMVMMGNRNDIRALPLAAAEGPQLWRATPNAPIGELGGK
ncbi:MAG: hypothetical protein AAGI28_02085 [Pseudomonadota bacterium]